MKLVLDTCTVLWAILQPDSLSPPAKEALTAKDAVIYLSPITAAELACAVSRKKVELNIHWKPWLNRFIKENGWNIAPIDLEIMEEAYSLADLVHQDPADRLIIATGRILGAAVVTGDRKILDYPHVKTIW